MLNIRIKASQITNLTDARYFAAMGVEWMGFSLAPGSNAYINPTVLVGIKEWVEGPKFVGSFQIQSANEISALAKEIELDAIQVGPFFPIEQLKQLSDYQIHQEIVVEVNSQPNQIIEFAEERSEFVDFFVLDFQKNGIDWNHLLNGQSNLGIIDILSIQQLKPVIIVINFSQNEVASLIQSMPGIGIAVKGGVEEKVGFKSYDELDEIFDAIENLEA